MTHSYRALALLVVGLLVLACIVCGTVLVLQDHDATQIANAGAALVGAVIALAAVGLFGRVNGHTEKGSDDGEQA